MIEASSFQIIYREAFGRQIQDVLNRCHNAIQDPMDTRQAQGSPASPIRTPMWSAWLRAPRPSRSSNPGGREGRTPGSGLQVAVTIGAECPR